MAEGFVNSLYPDRHEAHSAGTEPSEVNPLAIEVMREVGIDISTHRSKNANDFLEMPLDLVVTVCDHAKETCPFFPNGKVTFHKGFEDPSSFKGTRDHKIAVFRRVRDEIKEWIEKTFSED